MTLLWLIVWFVADRIGDREALVLDPENVWVGNLILAVGLVDAPPHAARAPQPAGGGLRQAIEHRDRHPRRRARSRPPARVRSPQAGWRLTAAGRG